MCPPQIFCCKRKRVPLVRRWSARCLCILQERPQAWIRSGTMQHVGIYLRPVQQIPAFFSCVCMRVCVYARVCTCVYVCTCKDVNACMLSSNKRSKSLHQDRTRHMKNRCARSRTCYSNASPCWAARVRATLSAGCTSKVSLARSIHRRAKTTISSFWDKVLLTLRCRPRKWHRRMVQREAAR